MKEWYIARGDKKYGPYSIEEMILLRQQRKVFEYDLVWKQGLRQWKTLIQTDEFSAQAIAERSLKAETCDVFNRRQWPRVRKEISVAVHNEEYLWNAKTLNISEGGALIELNSPFLKPGDSIHLHFQTHPKDSSTSSDTHPFRFSCMGTVTGKRYSNERLRFNSMIQYNIRFDEMDQGASSQLAQWVEKILKEKETQNFSKGVKNVAANS